MRTLEIGERMFVALEFSGDGPVPWTPDGTVLLFRSVETFHRFVDRAGFPPTRGIRRTSSGTELEELLEMAAGRGAERVAIDPRARGARIEPLRDVIASLHRGNGASAPAV